MLNKLYEKYTMRNIPNKFSINEIDSILKDEYKVTEIDKSTIGSMIHDPDTNFDEIVKCYKIDKHDILSQLFSVEEKGNFAEVTRLYQSDESTHYDEQDLYNQQIQTGKLVVIFLASTDGTFVNYFNLLGHSEKMYQKLTVLMGLEKEDCNLDNPLFQEYLQALSATGYLEG
ncbi:hypothetical protein [Bacillus cereus]|uniref:hypothetical protein n=1 Tax=Bacillus cereus TaxID=1396 RepID=UPI00156B6153|nr:hypothetical protein [Bacillus cereus]UDV85297.1 hypothetical protein HQJ03_027220 [Bacillus cereus]UDV90785.1 hypothetical protein HQG80_026675 [Bacillus cereus]HDR6255658.1 hypothetical protein [Bacillus cereus]HDR6260469.1 hypothetical protein [Bacillus cereus]